MSQKIHLDTDIGGDMDDVAALALLLKWPDLTLTGVTTNAESNGRRAGYARYVLDHTGHQQVPVAAGADLSEGYFRYNELGYPPEAENWPELVAPQPNPTDEAVELLRASVEQDAVLVGIGAFTNFMLLDQKYPGILRDANLYLMGGYVYDIPQGYPQFNREDDWNMQLDVKAAQYIFDHADPTLIPLTLTAQTALRHADLPALAEAGWLGKLLVRQAEVFARTEDLYGRYGPTSPALPSDFINFHHDPLVCAIALGWREGVSIETVPLKLEMRDTYLYETPDANGRPTRLVTTVDVEAFNRFWLDVVTAP
ncbi:MAG: nucleoside hydrolase [Chloroflexi bacterium]|nr:nucleoside hydrolase [Chloroflexota bacterium]MCC6892051.1 nucleoside hydrolase [Anaerolineae bacterium]